jgi:tetratricopeptide (TPR) repeat protein
MQARMTFQYRVPRSAENRPHADLPLEEAEKLLLAKLKSEKSNAGDSLWELASLYASAGKAKRAISCFRKAMSRTRSIEDKARCVLAMGGTMEKVHDYQTAVQYYKQAFAMEPMNIDTWYWINNNLGFCFNALGRYEAAQAYCQAAIKVQPSRANAYKNLGISMEGLREYSEAARTYIWATQVDAADPRALLHLESLLAKHPQLQAEFGRQAELCRRAVRFVRLRMEPVMRKTGTPVPKPANKKSSRSNK